MKPETLEWINKAEADWRTMLRESEVSVAPSYDAVCFHAQQCIEKYLKARLVDADSPFRKTHDLLNLLESVLLIEPQFKIFYEALTELTVFAVAYRYPGIDATFEQSRRSVEHCTSIRKAVRGALQL